MMDEIYDNEKIEILDKDNYKRFFIIGYLIGALETGSSKSIHKALDEFNTVLNELFDFVDLNEPTTLPEETQYEN